ncbi:BON domain-containing protein (plasmid) [Azospirillum thermophilum]|uniref:BON domain-containing protein n=2 Tax=Azospirillum thermophilum TaxID=2202148 RepID=A0A2S2CXR5_9PROT|nr:BON domain-containing protein [Azospirillum thermophilum]
MTFSRRPHQWRDGERRRTVGRWIRLFSLVGVAVASAGASGCAPLVIGGAAGTAVVASEHRGLKGFASDTDIRAQINHLWLQHSLSLANRIGLTVDHGRVLLTGRAADAQMRLDAVRLAWQADGVKEVINEIQVDNESGILDSARDTWISTQLRTKITFDGDIHSQNYSIDTINGVVYLMGTATTQDEMDRVVQHARSVPNVQRVVNYVRLLSSL